MYPRDCQLGCQRRCQHACPSGRPWRKRRSECGNKKREYTNKQRGDQTKGLCCAMRWREFHSRLHPGVELDLASREIVTKIVITTTIPFSSTLAHANLKELENQRSLTTGFVEVNDPTVRFSRVTTQCIPHSCPLSEERTASRFCEYVISEKEISHDTFCILQNRVDGKRITIMRLFLLVRTDNEFVAAVFSRTHHFSLFTYTGRLKWKVYPSLLPWWWLSFHTSSPERNKRQWCIGGRLWMGVRPQPVGVQSLARVLGSTTGERPHLGRHSSLTLKETNFRSPGILWRPGIQQ